MSTEEKNESWDKIKTLVGVLMVLGIMWWGIKSMINLWKNDRKVFWFIVIGGVSLYLFFAFLEWCGITKL